MLPYLCHLELSAKGKSRLRTQEYVGQSSLPQASLTDLGQLREHPVRKPPAAGTGYGQD